MRKRITFKKRLVEIEMAEACISNDFEHINISQRDVKGYNFEVRVNNVFKNIGIEYTSNPLQNIALWKRYQGIGTDFKIPLWNWEIEAKYSDAKIFPSWIDRSWIPRFKNGTFKVTVHNRGMKLSTNSLEKCFIRDIYLVEIGYLRYVLKAEMKHRLEANKVFEPKNTKKQDTKNQNSEKQKQNSEIEGLEPESSKSSATFRNKIETKLKKVSMNLLSSARMLVLKLWKASRRVFYGCSQRVSI
jgi:hypothetical protein